MRGLLLALTLVAWVAATHPVAAQSKYHGADGRVRVALSRQPLSPNGPSKGPATMAEGGIQGILTEMGATVRVEEARLTREEETEYGGWKRLGMSLGHFADIVSKNERDGYLDRGTAGHMSVDAGPGGGAAALGPDARGDQDRHAVARRASRFQHA